MEVESEDNPDLFFTCKSDICVVCATGISSRNNSEECADLLEESAEESIQVRADVFFKGLLVLCEALNVERKYADAGEWGVSGDEDLVRMICCKKCYALLGKLVELQDLISATQIALQNGVQKIKECIVQSEDTAREVEYSINTCLKFRQDVLQSSSCSPGKRRRTIISYASKKFRKSSSRLRRYKQLVPKVKRDRREPLSVNHESLYPIVKLERADFNTKPIEDDQYLDRSSPLSYNDIDNHDDQPEDFEMHQDSTDHEASVGQIDIPIPRKRGRPRKHFPKDDEVRVKKKPGRPRKHLVPVPDKQEDMPVAKRKRGRPRKQDSNNTRGSAEDKDHNHVRKQGRPLKYDRTALLDKLRAATVYVLDYSSGVFMYLNIKFKKEDSVLLCKHPDCSYSVPNLGYFTDQTAFKSMKLHIRNLHRRKYNLKGEEDRKKYQCCCHCDMLFNTKLELLAHKREVHPDVVEPLTLCEICGDVMHHQAIFQHVRTHKNEEEKALIPVIRPKRPIRRKNTAPPAGTRTFPCDQCGKIFTRKGTQQIHMQTHIPVELRRQVICDICGLSVASTHNLKIHKQFVHFRSAVRPAFECHICGKTYMSNAKGRFQAHVNAHLKLTPFQCTHCGKGFHGKRGLILHEASHQETASIQCPYCPKWYKSEKYLKRHLVAHHPHALPQKRRPESFQQPREEPFGPKLMFPCEPCSVLFVYKSRLVKHFKEKHGLHLQKSEDYPNQLTLEDNLQMIMSTALICS